MFDKPIQQLVASDIRQLITVGVQEGLEVDFKEQLPAKKGSDPWTAGEDKIGDHARNKLLKEVVAFANAYGGTLILGVKETQEKPPRAEVITPVRDCVVLAERLSHQCGHCIDPPIPLLQVAGVPTQDDGAGVVVFHVPRSRNAPHRHLPDKECYIRRADRSEPMPMREIQDLTLRIDRGLQAIDNTFSRHSDNFNIAFSVFERQVQKAFAIQITLVPLVPIEIERVFNNSNVQHALHTFQGRHYVQDCQLFLPAHTGRWVPALRATEATSDESADSYAYQRVSCNGELLYQFFDREVRQGQLRVYAGWLLGLLCNALCAAKKFRNAAGAFDVEYGLQIEMSSLGGPLSIGGYTESSYGGELGRLSHSYQLFPKYSVGPTEDFQQLVSLFERDLWHSTGKDVDQFVQVDFEKAFIELGLN